jgi:uncharacterized protein
VIVFEYNPEKSNSNLQKHGIDFEQAQMLWQDKNLLILVSRFPDEQRYLAIGQISELPWTAIFTERDERIRLISVRRSRKEEKALYEQNRQIEP